MGICDYFIERLKEGEDVDEFALWAFGEGYETKYAYQLVPVWNELHRHQYVIYPENCPADDADVMLDLWRESKQIK